jgi:hypothetical protein
MSVSLTITAQDFKFKKDPIFGNKYIVYDGNGREVGHYEKDALFDNRLNYVGTDGSKGYFTRNALTNELEYHSESSNSSSSKGYVIDYAGMSRSLSKSIGNTVDNMNAKAIDEANDVRRVQSQIKQEVEQRVSYGSSSSYPNKLILGLYDCGRTNEVFIEVESKILEKWTELKEKRFQYSSSVFLEYNARFKKNLREWRMLSGKVFRFNEKTREEADLYDPFQEVALGRLYYENLTGYDIKFDIQESGDVYAFKVGSDGKELPNTRKDIAYLKTMTLPQYYVYDYAKTVENIKNWISYTLAENNLKAKAGVHLLDEKVTNTNGESLTVRDLIDSLILERVRDSEFASILQNRNYRLTIQDDSKEGAEPKLENPREKTLVFIKCEERSLYRVVDWCPQLTDEQRLEAVMFLRGEVAYSLIR